MDPRDAHPGRPPGLRRGTRHRGALDRRPRPGLHRRRRPGHGPRHRNLRPHRQGGRPRPAARHRLLVPLLRRRRRLPRGPHPHRTRPRRLRGGAAPRSGLLRQLGGRPLRGVPPSRGPRRPGRLAAPGRLHLRVRHRRLRHPRHGRPPALPRPRDRHPRRLPHPARPLQDRPGPPGAARRRPGRRHLGRPRVRQRHLVRGRGEPHRGRGGRLGRPAGRREAGVLRVDAGPPGGRGHHLPPAALRQAGRPVAAGPALLPLAAGLARRRRRGRPRAAPSPAAPSSTG
ncbi:hypothetical protein RKD39_005095 [Streptomyces albogriseolus]